MKRKPTYSREFKIETVRLAEQADRPVTQITRELGVRQNQIYNMEEAARNALIKSLSRKRAGGR